MLYVIAYDVRDGRRLRGVAKYCARFGVRVGLSVFETRFENPDAFEAFSNRLNALIDPERDLIRIYRVCENCIQKRRVLGKSRGETAVSGKGDAYVF